MQGVINEFITWSIGFLCVSVCYFIAARFAWQQIRKRRQASQPSQSVEPPAATVGKM